MRWTLGLLLAGAVGCGGYRHTRMVACPQSGCSESYASASPEGLPVTPHERVVNPNGVDPALPAPPLAPLPDTTPTPPEPTP